MSPFIISIFISTVQQYKKKTPGAANEKQSI